MNANQRRRRTYIAHHQGNGFFFARAIFRRIRASAQLALKAKDAELTPPSRELRGRNLLN
jgi:hypothetical protein